MTVTFVLILIALALFVVYILFSGEEKKINEKSAPRGKVEEYCAAEKDRRSCQRLNTKLELKYNLISSLKFAYPTSGRNVSKAGVSLLVYEIFPKDSLIEMEISIPNEKNTFKAKGRVVWCEDQNGPKRFDEKGKRTFIAGVEFVDTDKKQWEVLAEYIHRHTSKDEKLQ